MDNCCCADKLSEIRICDDKVIDVNYQFLELTGYEIGEVLGKSLIELKELLKSDFMLNMSINDCIEEFIFTKQLYPRHVKIEIRIDEFKKQTIYSFKDIEDFKLEERYPGLDHIINSNINAIGIYSANDFKLIRANKKHIDFYYGFLNENRNYIGVRVEEVIPTWYESSSYKAYMNVIETNKQYYEKEKTYKTENGKIIRYSYNLIPIAENNVVKYIIAITEENTKDNVSSRILEKGDKLYTKENVNLYNFINTMDLPIVRISYPDFRIIDINDRVFKAIGQEHKLRHNKTYSLINKSISKLVPDFLLEENINYIKNMEKTKKTVEVNNYKINIKGKTRYFNFIYHPFFDMNNELYEFMVIVIDVTADMQQRIDLEKILHTQEEFFSYIAHEFKTPLTVTYSALQLLDYFCSEELSDRAKRFINKIRQSSLQQLRLVNNLLDITKLDSGYMRLNKSNYDIVFMTEAIVNSVIIIGREKGIEIVFSSKEASRLILIDDEKFERILLNVLSNAIKFTPSGKKVYVDLFTQNGFVNIRVKDEGIGIPGEKQEKIFERFGQVNDGLIKNGEGTGIGLCLAKMLARALGGDITLESELGIGSEFTILIPDISTSNIPNEKIIHAQLEDRLVQSVNVEFSTIYK